jgi:hypothetical protein
MARGFESKDVEYQQAEAGRDRSVKRTLTPAEREETARRRSLELALSRSRNDLTKASSPAHRRMLEQAIAELERQLAVHA